MAGGGDDLRLGVGVLLVLKGDLGGVGPHAVRLAGGGRGDSAGHLRRDVFHMGGVVGAGEGGSGLEIIRPLPHRLAIGVAGGRDDLGLGVAAHGAGVGHDAILGAGSRRGDLTVIPRVLAALRGAGHVVHPHYIAVLQLVSPQCGIDGLAVVVALNGHLPIDGEHPAGPTAEGAVAAGKAHAVGIGDTGEIGAAAGVGILVLRQSRHHGIRCRAVISGGAGVGGALQIGEVLLEGAALHIHGNGQGLQIRILDALGADDGDGGGNGLLVELGKLLIVGIALELLVVFGVLGVGQNTVHRNVGVVLGLGHQQRLMGHHSVVAGAEAAVLLSIVPAGNIVRLDAHGIVAVHVADELIAGGGGDDLDEGAHIAGDVVTVGVGLADALPVHILGAYQLHEGGGSVQLLLGQRLNGEGDILAGQHRHGGVIRTLAAGAGEDLHGDGDGLGLLTGQGAIGQHPGHIGRGGTGGHHHIGVAGIQHDGGVLAVEALLIIPVGNGAELLGGGQLDVGDHVCSVDLGIVTGILQADLTHRRLQQRLIVHGGRRIVALDHHGIDLVQVQILPAVIDQLQGQGHAGVLLGLGHRDRIGCKVGVRDLLEGDHAGVAGGPRGGGPQFLIRTAAVVHLALIHAGLQGIPGQAGEVGGTLHRLRHTDAGRHGTQSFHGLFLVQRNAEQAPGGLLGVGVAGQHQRRPHGAGSRRGAAVFVPLILDGAVGRDAHVVIAAVRRLLHADGDVRDPGSLQLGPEHGQCIGVLAVGDVVGTANGLLGGLQLGLGLRLLRRLALRPDSIEVVCLAVLAAFVPTVTLLEGAVDGGAVGILDGAAVAALRPTGEGIALPTVAAGRQLNILTEGCRLVGHGAGGGVLVAVLDVILDDVLIVTPLGDESHLVAAEHGVLGDGLTEGAVGILDVPAVQCLVGGAVVAAQRGQAGEYLVRRHGLVLQRVLIAVAVEVDSDALGPVGVQMEAVFGVHGGELVGRAHRIAALRRIEPAVKDIAGADGVLNGVKLGAAALLKDVVVVAAHDAGAGAVLCAVIVRVQGHIHRQAVPSGVERDRLPLLGGQVLHRLLVGIAAAGGAGGCAPAVEVVAGAGKGVLGQRDLLIIGGRDGVHGSLAALTAAEGDGVGNGAPLSGVDDVAGDHRLRRQLLLAVEPALEGIALLGGVCGNTAADGAVLGDQNGGVGVAVAERDGVSVRPHGVQIQIRLRGDGGTVLIDHRPVGGGGPTGEDLALAGEGIGLQGALAAEDLLRGSVLRAVVGVEGHHQRLTGGEVPQIDAVVELVAAAVLLVQHSQLVAPLGVQLQTLPVLVAALAVDEGGAAQCDGALVVSGLGGDLILEGQVGIFCKSQGQGAGGVVLSGIAGHEDLLAVLGTDLPCGGAGAGISGDGEPVEIVVNGLLGRKDRRGDQAHQHDHRQHHGEQSLFHVAFFLSLILSLSPARRHFRRRRRKSEGTDAKKRVRTGIPMRTRFVSKRPGGCPSVGRHPIQRPAYLTYPARPASQ